MKAGVPSAPEGLRFARLMCGFQEASLETDGVKQQPGSFKKHNVPLLPFQSITKVALKCFCEAQPPSVSCEMGMDAAGPPQAVTERGWGLCSPQQMVQPFDCSERGSVLGVSSEPLGR